MVGAHAGGQGDSKRAGGIDTGPSGVGLEQVWQVWLGGMASLGQVVEDFRSQTEELGFYSKGARKA